MPGGGLFDPLGVDRVESERPSFRPSAPVVVATVCVAATLVLIAIAWIRDDGDRGDPRAVSPITRVDAPPKPQIPPPATVAPGSGATTGASGPPLSGLPPLGADQEVEIQNGVRVIRPRRSDIGGVLRSQSVTVPTGTSPGAR